MLPPNVPCPLTDEHCQQLDSIIAAIPQIQALVKECVDCEIQIPGISESLERNLSLARKLRDLYAKHNGK